MTKFQTVVLHCALVSSWALIFEENAGAQVTVAPLVSSTVLDGDSPHLLIKGLRPGEIATVHAFRQTTAYTAGTYTGIPVLAHAEVAFAADSTGRITVDSAVPLSGTYSGPDPLGLLWSGTRLPLDGDPAQPATRELKLNGTTEVVVRVETSSLGNKHWAETRLRLTDGADGVEVQEIALSGLNGAFAQPKNRSTRPLPAILLLHGSEGGSKASARATAIRFANLGYAAFAMNYFAWPAAGLTGVPQAFVDIPAEGLATARTWLMQQPGVDADHLAVWGASKGAEFALLGASHYPWIDRVVACVPSSVVWSGFGRPPAIGEVYSSWSIAGKGLPYIAYDNFQDALDRKFSSAYVHQRSFDKATAPEQAAARIPIERASADILLLAATNDVVWPSGVMTDEIEKTLSNTHTRVSVHSLIFPNASHYICGTGSEPRRINPVVKPEGNDPSPEADAHAAEMGWKATKAFLKR